MTGSTSGTMPAASAAAPAAGSRPAKSLCNLQRATWRRRPLYAAGEIGDTRRPEIGTKRRERNRPGLRRKTRMQCFA